MKLLMKRTAWIVVAALLLPSTTFAAPSLQSRINAAFGGVALGETRRVVGDTRLNMLMKFARERGFVKQKKAEVSFAVHSDSVEQKEMVDGIVATHSATRFTLNNLSYNTTKIAKEGKREIETADPFAMSDVVTIDSVYQGKTLYVRLAQLSPEVCSMISELGMSCEHITNQWVSFDSTTSGAALGRPEVRVGNYLDIADQKKFKETPVLIPVRLVKTTKNDAGEPIVVIATRINPRFLALVREEWNKKSVANSAYDRAKSADLVRITNLIAAQSRVEVTVNTRTNKLEKVDVVAALHGPIYTISPTFQKKTMKIIGSSRTLEGTVDGKLFHTGVVSTASPDDLMVPENPIDIQTFIQNLSEPVSHDEGGE